MNKCHEKMMFLIAFWHTIKQNLFWYLKNPINNISGPFDGKQNNTNPQYVILGMPDEDTDLKAHLEFF